MRQDASTNRQGSKSCANNSSTPSKGILRPRPGSSIRFSPIGSTQSAETGASHEFGDTVLIGGLPVRGGLKEQAVAVEAFYP